MKKNKNKKILFVITKANWGGAQKYVFDLASEMVDRSDYEVVVAYGEPFGELNYKLKEAGIRTIEIAGLGRDINFFGEFRVAKNLCKILKNERPDIIHLNSPKIGGLGGILGRLIGIEKIIYTAHGWTFNEKRPAWQILLIKYFSWLTILFSHKTIVIAKREYKQVIGWPLVSDKKLVHIYNGIKPIYFLNRDEAQNYFTDKILESSREVECNETTKRSRNGKLWTASQTRRDEMFDDDLVIGTIAELHKNKGLKYLIKAFKKLVREFKSLKLIIIGEGEEREYLDKKLNKYSLVDNVFLVGSVNEASRYLKAFDIFVLPSVKEGFPFVLLEAGLAKLPVVASDVGGISELI